MTRLGMIAGALISALISAAAIYLFADALRSGYAIAPPASRYRRDSNPFGYWFAVLGLAVFLYMCLFTLWQFLRPFVRRGG